MDYCCHSWVTSVGLPLSSLTLICSLCAKVRRLAALVSKWEEEVAALRRAVNISNLTKAASFGNSVNGTEATEARETKAKEARWGEAVDAILGG